MPIDHRSGADGDPFVVPSQLFGQDGAEDPERITAGRYRLPDLTIGDAYSADTLVTGTGPRKGGWQRVTTLVKAIGDARALDLWHQRLLILAMVKRPDLYDLACATVATTPEESLRGELESLAGKLLNAVGADEGANLGTAFHGFTEARDLGMQDFARVRWHGKLTNYRNGLEEQGLIVKSEFVERRVVVLEYGLAGTLDRIVYDRIADMYRIADLKSVKKFWTWLEFAAQFAAYAMADAMWDRAKMCYVEMPKVAQDFGVAVWMPVHGYLPEDTSRGVTSHGDEHGVDFFDVDLSKGREALALCARVDRIRSEAKAKSQTWGLLRPAPELTVVEAYARRLGGVSSLAEGSALWAEVVKAGVSESPELIELARERVSQLQSELAMR
jgi:hypothetical protein